MPITAPPRSGKDTFGNVFAYKIKRYFKGIKVIRDDRAKPAFGEYTYWDNQMLINDLDRMAIMAKQQGENAAEKVADKWLTEQGAVMMHKSVVLFTEAWQKMSNRNPMAVENKVLGGLNKMWGHTETLFMYVAQTTHDLDRFTCLPWVTMEVRCRMSEKKKDTIEAHLYHVVWDRNRQRLKPIDEFPVVIRINAGIERPELGISNIDPDGTIHYFRYWDLFNSKSAPLLKFNRKKMEM
jgi:hypothetical protein